MHRDTKGWIAEYQRKGALWIHDGNPKRPHALLTSGKHSSGFFNSGIVMEDTTLLDQASSDLVEILREKGLILDGVNRVVGPAMGAITLAHDIARHIARLNDGNKPCLSGFTEKFEAAGKMMVFKRTNLNPSELILIVEDVLTTGGSIELTATAVAASCCYTVPFVAVLVNRSGLREVNGKKVVALIDQPMPIWEPDDCPLCKEGSEAIRPKGRENWARLNATC